MALTEVQKAAFLKKDIASLSPLNAGGSDEAYVKSQYEAHWGKKIEGVKKKIAAGESIAHMIAVLRQPPHLIPGYNRVAGHPARLMLKGFEGLHDDNVPLSRLGVSESHYNVVNNFEPLVFLTRIASKYSYIVELGAGPGWNLFNMATYLGKSVNSRRLFGLEYSDAGIEIMKLLSNHAGLPLDAMLFDYTAPDISAIPDDKPTLFFSHHSIEQVEDISPDLYAMLAARKSPTKLIHIEPIGWQRFPDMVKARVDKDDSFFHKLVERRLDNIRGNEAVAINSAINSWRVSYNRNTLPLIREFEAAGKLSVTRAYYDFTHSTNVNSVNPSTFLEINFPGA